ncbi:MAG: integrase family protein [Pseudomonadota bacterium]|nr:integrase family protein [Pseudomonadota bacterium]
MPNLTEAACRAAACPPKVKGLGKKYWDGDCLYLFVSKTTQRKAWRFDYMRGGRARTLTLGHFPTMSLAAARREAAQVRARMTLDPSFDPAEARAVAREEAARRASEHREGGLTFEQAFLSMCEQKVRKLEWQPMDSALRKLWLAGSQLPRGKRHPESTEHANRDRGRRHLFPELAHLRMDRISARKLADVINSVGAGNEREKVRQLMTGTFDFWLSTQPLGTPNPCQYMAPLETRPVHVKGNHPAITDPSAFGEMLRKIFAGGRPNSVSASICLIKCQAYLFQRTGAISSMRWGEIDFERRIWRCPKSGMKTSQVKKLVAAKKAEKGSDEGFHLIPLPPQVISILRKLQPFATCEYVFEGLKKGEPLSDAAENEE